MRPIGSAFFVGSLFFWVVSYGSLLEDNDTKGIQAEFKQKCTKPNGFENRPKTLFKAKWTAKPVFRCPFGSLLVLCSLLVFSFYHYSLFMFLV